MLMDIIAQIPKEAMGMAQDGAVTLGISLDAKDAISELGSVKI